MQDFIFKLLGLDTIIDKNVAEWHFEFANAHLLWIVVLASLVFTTLAVIAFLRTPRTVSFLRRTLILAFRLLAFAVLMVIFLAPVVKFRIDEDADSTVFVLLDDSKSMAVADTQMPDAMLVRNAKALGMQDGEKSLTEKTKEDIRNSPRTQLVKGALEKSELLDNLEKKFNVSLITFSRGIDDEIEIKKSEAGHANPAQDVLNKYAGTGDVTQMGLTLESVLKKAQGQIVSTCIVFSDGQNNSNISPEVVSRSFANYDIPIYTVKVGSVGKKDIALAQVFADDKVFLNESTPVAFRVTNVGMGEQSVEAALAEDGNNVAAQTIKLTGKPEENFSIAFTPANEGVHKYTLSLAGLDGEYTTDNNSKQFSMEVIDQKMKVLYVEGYPRWEFRFIKNLLAKDKRVDLSVLLVSCDKSEPSEGVYINTFPSRDELFKYDAVILGDVNPSFFTQMELYLMSLYVWEEGGGFLIISGKRHTPEGYVPTSIERMIPVKLDAKKTSVRVDEVNPFHIDLTTEGMFHELTRLTMDATTNEEFWNNLPDVYWFDKAIEAKPTASVLLKGNFQISSAPDVPILATFRYGKGRVLYSGLDETWRWRRYEEGKYYDIFWRRVVRFLGLDHLLKRNYESKIYTDKTEYGIGERVVVYGRFFKDNAPVGYLDKVNAKVTKEGELPVDVEMKNISEELGLFKGEFYSLNKGEYSVEVALDEKTTVSAKFDVKERYTEETLVDLNGPLMDEVATNSGGKSFYLDEIGSIASLLEDKSVKIPIRFEISLWDKAAVLGLFVFFAAAEWFIRKRSYLP